MNDSLSPYAPPTEQSPRVDLDVELAAARRAFRGPTPFGYKLVIGGFAVFVVSLALPAITVRIFTSSEMPGFGALFWCFLIALEKPLSIMPFLALSNLWIVFLPLLARAGKPGRLVKVACGSWIAFACVVSLAVYPFGDDRSDLLVGYYVWALSFFLGALGATLAAVDARRKAREEAV